MPAKLLRTLAWMAALSAPAPALHAQPAAGPAASAPSPAPATPTRRNADAALVRALKDHRWTLQAATDAAGQPLADLLVPGHPFVLRFDDARLGAQGGCNQLSGSWRLSPRDELRVGPLASTMKACEAPLAAADRAFGALLAQPLQARVDPGAAPTLRLAAAQGPTLSFTGQRTPESLYGAPTRIFLEVAPQRVACTPALMPPTTCLQVRERRYDAQGLRVGEPGPWQAFYGTIDGYTHEPGVRNVLRLKRFERPRPPADASRYVYVLDLVVESEVVERK
jgi:heat shock protein HslJ